MGCCVPARFTFYALTQTHMHLLVQSIKRGGYFCIALPPTGWSPPLGKVSWNLPYGQCLLQHSEEFITVDYQSFLMHTKLIAVHFFLLPTALGCSLIHESGFTALSSKAGKGDSFGAWFNPVYLLTVLTGTISTQQADSFPARALGCLESLSTSPLLWTPGRRIGRSTGRGALSTILLTLVSRPLKVYGPQAAHPD